MKRHGLLLTLLLAFGCNAETPTFPSDSDDAIPIDSVSGDSAGGDLGADVSPDTDDDDVSPGTDAPEDVPPPDTAEDAPPADDPASDSADDVVEDDVPDDTAEDAPTADLPEDVPPSPDIVEDTPPDAPPADTHDAPDLPPGPYCGADDAEFPEFDDECSRPDDCAAVLHQIDCCGTEAAIGINAGELAAFEAAEAICREGYPRCRCATRPTEAQDGRIVRDMADLGVTCRDGACRTFVARSDEVDCTATHDSTFPEFDRSCEEEDDCEIVLHQTDCCGNQRIIGINEAETGRFEAAEAECRSEYPGCGCPASAPVTDAGIAAWDLETVEVMCRDEACFTFVPID